MTGRKGRIVMSKKGRAVYQPRVMETNRNQSRAAEKILTNLNLQEKDAFLDGRKLVAIISEAASTGISLHADQTRANTRRRLHITMVVFSCCCCCCYYCCFVLFCWVICFFLFLFCFCFFVYFYYCYIILSSQKNGRVINQPYGHG